MKCIITPKQVLEEAFSQTEYLPESIVSESDIMAAQERYILPIVGAKLTSLLETGSYQELAFYYIAPPLALATRLLIQPTISLRMGAGGLTAPRGEAIEQPDQDAVKALQKSLKIRMRQLLKRLSNYLNDNADKYPEYNPEYNVLNRCSIDGGLVQIM